MWVSRPRHGTAVVLQPARLLVVSHLHFEELLSLLPDFRAYINRSTRMAGAYNQKRDVTLEQSMREEEQQASASSVAMRWQSGSKLGGQGLFGDQSGKPERSVFAERWERIVSMLLNNADDTDYTKAMSTISFKTEDYIVEKGLRGTLAR